MIDAGLIRDALSLLDVAELFASGGRSPSVVLITVAACFLAFVLLRVIPITLPRGESVKVDAYALILSLLSLRPIQALVVGILATILINAASSESHDSRWNLPREMLQVALSILLAAISLEILNLDTRGELGVLSAGAVCLLAAVVVDVALEPFLSPIGWGAFRNRNLIVRELILSGMGVVHVSVATAAVSVSETLGVLGILLALVVVAALQESVALYFKARRTYWQTVAALARAAEMALPHARGASQALADFVVEVGRHLRLPRHQLEQLDFAARLKDVGRLSGSADDDSAPSVLERSAQIVRGIGMLEQAGRVIEASIPGKRFDDEETMRLGEIIRASSRYLAAVSSSPGAVPSEEMLAGCSRDIREAVLTVGFSRFGRFAKNV